VFAHAAMMRVGLGNMLFPWARAEVFAHRSGVRMLAPQWTLPKIGPMLRREKDKRLYIGLFDGRSYVRGPRRWMALWRGKRVDESHADALMQGRLDARGTTVVEFRGHEGWFTGMAPHQNLLPHRDLVARRLIEILSPTIRQRLRAPGEAPVIAAHIRRGDKPTMRFMEPYPGNDARGLAQHHRTMADEWYVNCIRSVRAAIGRDARVQVFSDARPDQLAPILSLENVTLAPENPSIVDIVLLSRARVLITTGTSSFSAWASYLGGMPTIWYPGLCVQLNPQRPNYGIETDLAGMLPPSAAALLRAATALG
jgi:hypothetical protein